MCSKILQVEIIYLNVKFRKCSRYKTNAVIPSFVSLPLTDFAKYLIFNSIFLFTFFLLDEKEPKNQEKCKALL